MTYNLSADISYLDIALHLYVSFGLCEVTCAAARSLAGPGESESPPVRSEPETETEDDQCWQTPGLGRTVTVTVC